MSKIDMLRLLITQRLTAAAEEIFGVFGRTLAEYEEEISRSKLEIERQRRLLDLVRKPQISLQIHDPAVSEQRKWSSSSLDLDKNHSGRIKQEEEDEEVVDLQQQDEMVDASEQNDVNFVLFQSSRVREQQDSSYRAASLPEFPSQDLEDPELEPPPGTSLHDSYSNLSEDEPVASDMRLGDDPLDSVDLDGPEPEVVDSYICTICGQAFAQRNHWVKHLQVHRSIDTKTDKSFVCDICGKRLTRFDGYQKHLRVHTGEKPYCCNICGRRFSDNSNYKRHVRTHTAQNSQLSVA
ncbi:zinc finger protein 775-like [Cololabis saira]|uniref:zinc finger protein 775-like n=1 Tax=Cololabis saira TaxID=129043 RepID=UPI002AD432E5|nr:zinc finger protein 775-like [Cololabis saira]